LSAVHYNNIITSLTLYFVLQKEVSLFYYN